MTPFEIIVAIGMVGGWIGLWRTRSSVKEFAGLVGGQMASTRDKVQALRDELQPAIAQLPKSRSKKALAADAS